MGAVRVCAEPGCPALLTRGSRCPDHVRRGYNDAAWARARQAKLAASPACEECGATGRLDVHHLDERGPRGPRGTDQENLQTLCRRCHNSARRGAAA